MIPRWKIVLISFWSLSLVMNLITSLQGITSVPNENWVQSENVPFILQEAILANHLPSRVVAHVIVGPLYPKHWSVDLRRDSEASDVSPSKKWSDEELDAGFTRVYAMDKDWRTRYEDISRIEGFVSAALAIFISWPLFKLSLARTHIEGTRFLFETIYTGFFLSIFIASTIFLIFNQEMLLD